MNLFKSFSWSLLLACATTGHSQNHEPGFVEMKHITRRDSPAHLAAKNFMRGANFGNYLEVPPKQTWAVKHSPEDLAHLRAEGFDHVRIPIGWHHYTGPAPEFKLSDEIFSKVDVLVTNALRNGINVIINLHHFDPFTTNPSAESNRFYAIWRQVAAHYAPQPPGLAFELINEPKDAATTLVLNPIYAQAIRVIRKTNPTRTLFVGPGKWNQVSELPNLRLPDNDDNLIVTIHCYDPFQFTHQGATWAGPDTKVKGIQFPGPPATALVPDPSLNLRSNVLNWIQRYNTMPTEKNPSSPAAFRGKIKQAREWSDYFGRPVHLGEFGCYTQADAASRARFHAEFRKALDEAGMGWALWDWKAGFKYWDEKTGQPAPGMKEALFPNRN
jgi:endoglucanase